jgi:iron complex transport system substrate-binding protein
MPTDSTHRQLITTAAAVLALLALSSSPPARGGAADSAPPQRVVSLVPAVTEMLFAIGAGARIVGVSSFDSYPPEVGRIARVGGLIDPDVERILSLRPDLVIVYGTQEDLPRQLARAGIALFVYRHGGLADVTRTMRDLGRRVGNAVQADGVTARIEADLAGIRTRVESRPRPRTLIVFGREPLSLRNLYASGGVGFLHDMLEVAGGTNIFANLRRESVRVNMESLLAARPEVVLDLRVDEGLSPGRLRQERDLWNRLPAIPAVRSGRVHVLTGQHLVVPGPRVVGVVEAMARALHPEAFAPVP